MPGPLIIAALSLLEVSINVYRIHFHWTRLIFGTRREVKRGMLSTATEKQHMEA